jgi:hypothetical protein
MVCHQAIGMDTMLEFFSAFLEKKKEPASILFFKKKYHARRFPAG